MNDPLKRLALLVSLPVLLLGASPLSAAQAAKPDTEGRAVLYWYDPMYPQQRFDKPGKSPFMDMDLVPRYAEEGGDAASISIDPGISQNLGMRLATASRETFDDSVEAVGALTFNGRDMALVQARSGGFVERVYDRAPEDVIEKGAPLADLLVPEWGAAQAEYLALRGLGEPELLSAARQRLRLAGMPAELIARLENTGRTQNVWTVTSPIGGVLQSLDVREGMTLPTGATLARVNGLDKVWLEVAVPEAQAAGLGPDQPVAARLPAFPGEALEGRIQAVLPQADLASRTVRVRVELPNPALRLRPGMTAEVSLAHNSQPALVIPTEAVIRTGKRSLVMLADDNGRYRPVEIRTGRETEEKTEVLAGLEEGQQVVASGQFLLDSEASLRGIAAHGVGETTVAAAAPTLHEAEGTIVEIDGDMVGLSHGPFKTLGMPGMTMPFSVSDLALLEGFKVGDRVRVGVSQTDDGLFIERLEKLDEHTGHEEHQP
ncbi:efflux RND transporter periplasmic adaptor subunit [Stutzerimonas stutzeri]|uniref:efflux RND transporter periplasmic adaptor subunit n=1 Tax=Stutzerimonas stutzeri TaxID=316 RepID=UPI001C2E1556|nr:efflux RND transporter periplasmic adaptor subunit [Stutzerimonas stutzeri]